MAARGLAVLPVLLASLVASTDPAHADIACGRTESYTHPPDKGGKDALVWWTAGNKCDFGDIGENGAHYHVKFHAYDEMLFIVNDMGFGQIRATVKVYNAAGDSVVDTDTIKGPGEHQLGTPDGTGNIPEGRKIVIRACGVRAHDGRTYCTDSATGRT